MRDNSIGTRNSRSSQQLRSTDSAECGSLSTVVGQQIRANLSAWDLYYGEVALFSGSCTYKVWDVQL